MHLLDGTALAAKIRGQVQKTIGELPGRKPGLAFILVGDDPASRAYVTMKKKRCQEVGILSFDRELPATVSAAALQAQIEDLNNDPRVDGILVQMPLPLPLMGVMQVLNPAKDVDGFHPLNMGKLLLGDTSGFVPCTPLGIQALLEEVPLQGKHVVIVGRSNIVGKPLSALLVQKNAHANATVTLAHSLSEGLPALCRSADILVAAAGHERLITASMVTPGSVVIDVGIHRKPGGKIVGDVCFDEVAPLCSHITPVPGGVGPMTIALLLSNTLLSYTRRIHGS
jgi:methylenetetrahydrofolate dehydrogenase (NADP+)/methenyltetrahydrofolate cyclohydrolase